MARKNIGTLIEKLDTLIEEQQQAELGNTELGEPISDYSTRSLLKLKEDLQEDQRKRINKILPDIEVVSAKVHEAWMEGKKAQGVTSRLAEDGEELMVPYEQLSEKAKDLDRGTVKAVYAAIKSV